MSACATVGAPSRLWAHPLAANTGRLEPLPDGPVLELELRDGQIHVGALPRRVLPASWVAWPLSHDVTGVGLVLPLGARRGLVVAVDRTGGSEWLVVDGHRVDPTALPAGRLVDDVCRIRLGFSTPLPDRAPDWYWLGRWLAAVIETAEGRASHVAPLDVITVAAAHPAIESDELVGLDLAGLCGFVVERHREHVGIADWECIQLDALDDPLHRFHELAVALDLGAFSRWVTASCAPLGDLASTLTACCSSFGLRLIGSVIADTMLSERVG